MNPNNLVKLITIAVLAQLSLWVNAQNSELDSLTRLFEQHTEEDSTRVNLLNGMAQNLYIIDAKRAFEYAKEANKISTQIKFLKGKAKSFRLMGITQNSYDEAVIYYNEALKIYQQLKDKLEISKCYINIGVAYRHQGNYPKALESYHESLNIIEELGDKELFSNCCNNIGVIHRYQGNYEQALVYYRKALKINEEIESADGIAMCLGNIGVVYELLKDYDTALVYHKKGLNGHLQNKPVIKFKVASSYYNIGLNFLHKKSFSKANQYFQKALAIAKEIGKVSIEGYSYEGLANVAIAQSNHTAAYNYGKKAYQIAKETGNVELIIYSSDALARISNLLGNYKEAYDYHVIFKELNDTLFSENNIREITQLEYEYKFEKEKSEAELLQQKKDAVRAEQEKKQRILLLATVAGLILMSLLVIIVSRSLIQKRKTNKILESQKEQLIELNNTKDKFFSIISHDLKSPFNAILGFSNLLLKEYKSLNDDERVDIIQHVSTSAESAFKLLDNLLTWAKSQSGSIKYSPNTFDFNQSIAETVDDLQGQATEKEIQIFNEVAEHTEVFGDKNMLSMVLRNLISNALKFTNNGGEVRVGSEYCEGKMLVSVSDTGIGIAEENLARLFKISENVTTIGTNNEKGTGLGLILCKEFIEQHGGSIWAEREVGKGTTFYFSIPTK